MLTATPEHPIAYVPDLIGPILRDEKIETRRIAHIPSAWSLPSPARYVDGFIYRWGPSAVKDPKAERIKCPYGKPGHRLWVRETFCCYHKAQQPCRIEDAEYVIFKDGIRNNGNAMNSADNSAEAVDERRWSIKENAEAGTPYKWRPPMHMPRWASRIMLEVVSIGVERVQQTTEAGAIAEGFRSMTLRNESISARFQFRQKWDEINGGRIDKSSGKKLTWALDPFVWVVRFKRLEES